MTTDQSALQMWTVYDHPADMDMPYVARLWRITAAGGEATGESIGAVSLSFVRSFLAELGLYRMDRSDDDDPTIVEVWL